MAPRKRPAAAPAARAYTLGVRLTYAELAEVAQAAAADGGRKPSEWVRSTILRIVRRVSLDNAKRMR